MFNFYSKQSEITFKQIIRIIDPNKENNKSFIKDFSYRLTEKVYIK